MGKMAKRPFEELTELLERELGDRLRVVLRIDGGGIESLFERDDLSLRSDEELGQQFVHAFPGAEEPSDLLPGEPRGPDCLVAFTGESVELLLYRHPTEAVAVGFDRADGEALGTFVDRSLATLR